MDNPPSHAPRRDAQVVAPLSHCQGPYICRLESPLKRLSLLATQHGRPRTTLAGKQLSRGWRTRRLMKPKLLCTASPVVPPSGPGLGRGPTSERTQPHWPRLWTGALAKNNYQGTWPTPDRSLRKTLSSGSVAHGRPSSCSNHTIHLSLARRVSFLHDNGIPRAHASNTSTQAISGAEAETKKARRPPTWRESGNYAAAHGLSAQSRQDHQQALHAPAKWHVR